MKQSQLIAKFLYPQPKYTLQDLESKFPKRSLPEGAVVTRFAPSPTGFVHIGSVYASLVSERLAHQSQGVFFLRIEDTDKKREIDDGVSEIVNSLAQMNICFDEGSTSETSEKGSYGPYKQSQRADIYQAAAAHLVANGLAYPCFCTEEELSKIRESQEKDKLTPGYYGQWAAHRNLSLEQIESFIKSGKAYVIRLKAPENTGVKVALNDLIKGHIEMPENDHDIVLLKSDGIPTYHFAHVVDDHFMRTTHVIRGDEWLSSAPLHLQLFSYFNWPLPYIAHISPILKMDGTSKRKLSKRKDPEAAVSFYHEQGYPDQAVIEYLINLINSGFEDWRKANPSALNSEFHIDLQKMNGSGALFDIVKLDDISKEIISKYTRSEATENSLNWAQKYNPEFYRILNSDQSGSPSDPKEYLTQILSIERGNEKPRKDIEKWRDLPAYLGFFYDSLFDKNVNEICEILCPSQTSENSKSIFSKPIDKSIIVRCLKEYSEIFDASDSNEQWFDKIKAMAVTLGFAADAKAFKAQKDSFAGHSGDVCMIIRVAVSGKPKTPDLLQCLQVLGKQKIKNRLLKIINTMV